MEKPLIKPKQGIILISEPSLRDFYFRQSVVLLAEHNDEGTFGVIINKPIEARICDVIKDFPQQDYPVYLGGPVKTDSIFFLHTREDVDNSLLIMQGLYWGGDMDTIKHLIENELITENEIRFFVGYSGWQPNQLDREIREKSWVLSHTSASEVINPSPEKLWSNYLKNMGKDYAIWANFPADPTYN
ncbi:MAG: YqgE/AlgH family protein [Bacteroidales bacterium]|nr:YqgE/AlgH family protein [Bacteroidales bacterium]MDD4604034.1 YqgE/AlgH family protein [Bacteroidales bacterium]